jgi:ABC-type antimicrobial peptide transport system permease subunit
MLGSTSKVTICPFSSDQMAGLLPGLAFAYVAARLIGSPLAGVIPADAPTFLAATALCLITALLGTLLAALRAVRVDPATVMRAE